MPEQKPISALTRCLEDIEERPTTPIEPRFPGEKGHDKIKREEYVRCNLGSLLQEYDVGVAGCGLCQVKVPCEFKNPTKKLKKTV